MYDHCIDATVVKLAITKLKTGKSDGVNGFISDHLKNASENMCTISNVNQLHSYSILMDTILVDYFYVPQYPYRKIDEAV